MLSVLIKHEYLRTRGYLGASFVILAIVTLAAAVAEALTIPYLATLLRILAIIALAGFLPVVWLLLTVDFWRTSFSRNGYLTQTFPIAGGRIFTGKFAWATLVTFIALAWVGILSAVLLMAVGDLAAGELLSALRRAVADVVTYSPGWLLVTFPPVFVLLLLTPLAQLYVVTSIGAQPRFRRMGAAAPFVLWILSYICIQLLNAVGLLVVPVGLVFGYDSVELAPLVRSGLELTGP
ncbi:MAG: hypothetical protein CSB46_09675, partial [Micrococcales bacterium]